MSQVFGIHHVTAVASDPQRNLDFYAGVLGLRLVKRTVNFDDPQTYHLYYGDEVGGPGSIMTFFPWPGARRGRPGSGQVVVTAFAVRPGAVGFWVERLLRHGVRYEGPSRRGAGAGAEQVLAFRDPTACAWNSWPTRLRRVARRGVGLPAFRRITPSTASTR
jgi:catechol 2,3-dioxygenase-like lactoylglutathione lyase family enzyme